MLVPDKKLVYSVYLASAQTPSAVPGGANVTTGASRTAIIEYSGVVVVAPDTQHLATAEGGKVRVSVWSIVPLCAFRHEFSFAITCLVLFKRKLLKNILLKELRHDILSHF